MTAVENELLRHELGSRTQRLVETEARAEDSRRASAAADNALQRANEVNEDLQGWVAGIKLDHAAVRTELQRDTQRLRGEMVSLCSALADASTAIAELKRAHAAELAAKDAECERLRGAMDEQARDMGDMLQDTLARLQGGDKAATSGGHAAADARRLHQGLTQVRAPRDAAEEPRHALLSMKLEEAAADQMRAISR